jgi:hypothetical protein
MFQNNIEKIYKHTLFLVKVNKKANKIGKISQKVLIYFSFVFYYNSVIMTYNSVLQEKSPTSK